MYLQLCAKTTIHLSPNIQVNKLLLNGTEESFENPRLKICLTEIKDRARQTRTVKSEVLDWNLEIVSENNFPTAAGKDPNSFIKPNLHCIDIFCIVLPQV